MHTILKNEIQVFSGVGLDPFDPNPDNMNIEDIAHALSMQCRYAGHCTQFWSVASHSVLCSMVADNDEDAKTMLMHDAAEAYLIDVCRPIKYRYPELTAMLKTSEEVIMNRLSKKFGFVWPMNAACKIIDDRMLWTEKRDIMAPSQWGTEIQSSVLPYEYLSCVGTYPEQAKSDFLKSFKAIF